MSHGEPGESSSRPAVLVCRALLEPGRSALDRFELREGGLEAARERLLELAPGVAAIVADPTVRVDRDLLDAAGAPLRIVANFAVGHDNVDLGACRERGVAVTNTPEVLTNATAELALALTFAAARGLGAAERDLRAGGWRGFAPDGYLGSELTGATFGIVGLGRIGERYAELVRPLAGRVLYASRSAKPEAEAALGLERVELGELLAGADVISLHAPAAAATRGLIGAPELERMRPSAILVNTSRGSLVDEGALVAALRSGRIAAAGLDVYAHEPAVGTELLAAPNCVLLPHIGSATRRAREGMARTVARNVLAALAGEEPPDRIA